MKRQQNSNLKWFTKVSLLLLYTCFFLGQLNFNYDSGSLIRQQLAQSVFQKQTIKHVSSEITKTEKTNDKKPNLHLNKRFQPESFLLGEVVASLEPNEFFLTEISYHYINPIVPNALYSNSYLRGPPAIA